MTWLSNNWIWIAFGVGMLAMHLFGHRHGQGRGSCSHDRVRRDPDAGREPTTAEQVNSTDGSPKLLSTEHNQNGNAQTIAKDPRASISIVRQTEHGDNRPSDAPGHDHSGSPPTASGRRHRHSC